jgi:hypothetical protein
VSAGALSASAERGSWGLIVYPVTTVSSIPRYRDFPEGHCCVGVSPIIALLDRDPGGSVRCRYSDYGMDSLSKEGMPSILKQPAPLPLHLPLIRGLQTFLC